ncbi:MAG: hypothetical protein Q4G71_09885 [Pseudomonadota bacterium]|nr:hypothetical protein [Pseudomonadota bacterium]
MTHQQYATADWRVSLPADWRHLRTSPDGVAYFESADGHYGLYIAVWDVGDAQRAANDVVDEFVQAECRNLDAMPEHAWAHAPHATGPGEALVDSLEQARHYRVICRLIAQPPLVLRASFHDYDCRDTAQSNRVLGPLLESVALTG